MKNPFDLSGKTILVTGASRGIGRAIAEALHGQGAFVWGTASKKENVAWMNQERLRGIEANAVLPGIWDDIIADIRKVHGRLDVLVNNAGIASNSPASSIKETEMEEMISVNFKAVFRSCQSFYKAQRKAGGGNIINVSSVLGLVGAPLASVYAGTKGAVIQMTRALAVEWAAASFRVNALCPGFINTDMTKMIRDRKSVHDEFVKYIPMKRMGEVQEMTGAVIFLASDASAYMTGQTLVVDGGLTAM